MYYTAEERLGPAQFIEFWGKALEHGCQSNQRPVRMSWATCYVTTGFFVVTPAAFKAAVTGTA